MLNVQEEEEEENAHSGQIQPQEWISHLDFIFAPLL